jgi:hypothetical protein
VPIVKVQVGAKALPIVFRSLSPRSGHRHGMAVRWHLPHCAAAVIRQLLLPAQFAQGDKGLAPESNILYIFIDD